MTSSTGTRHEAPNGKMEVEVGKSEVINSTTSVTSIAADQVSSLSNARSSGGKRSRVSPQAASAGSAHNISVKTLSDGAAETSSQLRGAQTATTLSEGIPEGEGNEGEEAFVGVGAGRVESDFGCSCSSPSSFREPDLYLSDSGTTTINTNTNTPNNQPRYVRACASRLLYLSIPCAFLRPIYPDLFFV